jgi:hypothetical protein
MQPGTPHKKRRGPCRIGKLFLNIKQNLFVQFKLLKYNITITYTFQTLGRNQMRKHLEGGAVSSEENQVTEVPLLQRYGCVDAEQG